MTRIPVEDLVEGGLYRLRSRNLDAGVYRAEDRAFIGIREKFNMRFLDLEHDWETGPPHGTAVPTEKIADCPLRPLVTHYIEGQYAKNNWELHRWIEETLQSAHDDSHNQDKCPAS
jgi:hypothetical protein